MENNLKNSLIIVLTIGFLTLLIKDVFFWQQVPVHVCGNHTYAATMYTDSINPDTLAAKAKPDTEIQQVKPIQIDYEYGSLRDR